MNKTELIDKIAAGAGISKADSKKALDATVNALKGKPHRWRQDTVGRFRYIQC